MEDSSSEFMYSRAHRITPLILALCRLVRFWTAVISAKVRVLADLTSTVSTTITDLLSRIQELTQQVSGGQLGFHWLGHPTVRIVAGLLLP